MTRYKTRTIEVSGLPELQAVYDLTEVYDIAFGLRDPIAECETLDAICDRFRGDRPQSFLDVACGPGYHCIEYARRGLRACGVDLNSSMIQLGKANAKEKNVSVEFVVGDMRDFELSAPVDLAFNAILSFHYLLTNDDIIKHLRAVARNLTVGGLYVIEALHPRDVFNVGGTPHSWEGQRGDVSVRARWGHHGDIFDPISQVCRTSVKIQVEQNGDVTNYEFTELDRHLTHQEFQMLVKMSEVFDAVAWLGRLDVNQPLTTDRKSYRMIPVLKRIG